MVHAYKATGRRDGRPEPPRLLELSGGNIGAGQDSGSKQNLLRVYRPLANLAVETSDRVFSLSDAIYTLGTLRSMRTASVAAPKGTKLGVDLLSSKETAKLLQQSRQLQAMTTDQLQAELDDILRDIRQDSPFEDLPNEARVLSTVRERQSRKKPNGQPLDELRIVLECPRIGRERRIVAEALGYMANMDIAEILLDPEDPDTKPIDLLVGTINTGSDDMRRQGHDFLNGAAPAGATLPLAPSTYQQWA